MAIDSIIEPHVELLMSVKKFFCVIIKSNRKRNIRL